MKYKYILFDLDGIDYGIGTGDHEFGGVCAE